MAAGDARPLPFRNVAFRLTAAILDADGDPTAGVTFDSGLASGAGKALVSKDAAAFANSSANVTAISDGVYYLDLTAGEMDADTTVVIFRTTTAGAKNTVVVLNPSEISDIVRTGDWDALLDLANGVESGKTLRAALRIVAAMVGGKASGAGTATEVFTGIDGSTTRVTLTVDASGNRSAVTYG